MFKIFDYKLWLIIGLVFLVVHLYQEVSSIKSSIKKIESNTNNNLMPVFKNQMENILPTNLELLPPIPNTKETINLNQVGKINIIENDDYKSESDLQIYSNDAFSTDISVGVTDNLIELKKFIDSKAFNADEKTNIELDFSSIIQNKDDKQNLETDTGKYENNIKKIITLPNKLNNSEELNNFDKVSNFDELDNFINVDHLDALDALGNIYELNNMDQLNESLDALDALDASDASNELNNMDESSDITPINLEELKKMKKNDLTELASKFNVGLVKKMENGKLKSKTKQELINDLNNYQSSKK